MPDFYTLQKKGRLDMLFKSVEPIFSKPEEVSKQFI